MIGPIDIELLDDNDEVDGEDNEDEDGEDEDDNDDDFSVEIFQNETDHTSSSENSRDSDS